MKVLILGTSGMIGAAMFRVLAETEGWIVTGSVRSYASRRMFTESLAARLEVGVDLENPDILLRLFRSQQPDVVVNCAGLTKHLPEGNDPQRALSMNAHLPHRLADLCAIRGARLIHVSTDCVFSGAKGNYSEVDTPDATDVYGKTKSLGEVADPHCVTLRTSTIGHEFATRHGLLEWFLSQSECKGFRRAIFSGVPTLIFAEIVRDYVIPNENLSGLYHVGASPIDKDRLLRLIADIYGKQISILPDDSVSVDRSLDSRRFEAVTGYRAPDWAEMIMRMHAFH
jgi:dTDP-4-dehydrorhamnose reductase